MEKSSSKELSRSRARLAGAVLCHLLPYDDSRIGYDCIAVCLLRYDSYLAAMQSTGGILNVAC